MCCVAKLPATSASINLLVVLTDCEKHLNILSLVIMIFPKSVVFKRGIELRTRIWFRTLQLFFLFMLAFILMVNVCLAKLPELPPPPPPPPDPGAPVLTTIEPLAQKQQTATQKTQETVEKPSAQKTQEKPVEIAMEDSQNLEDELADVKAIQYGKDTRISVLLVLSAINIALLAVLFFLVFKINVFNKKKEAELQEYKKYVVQQYIRDRQKESNKGEE